SSHEPDVFVAPPTVKSRAIEGWRWNKIANPYDEKLPEAAPGFDDSKWATVDVRRPNGPLGLNERGLFRASFSVSAADLAADGVELRFGKLAGGGHVFLDGKRIGPTGDPRAASTYDVRSHLAPGRHTVAVALANYGAAAGVNDGAELRFYTRPRSPAWSRSTFNG